MSRRGTLSPTEVTDPPARGWSRRLRYPDWQDWPDCCCLLLQLLNEIGAIQTRPADPLRARSAPAGTMVITLSPLACLVK